MQNKNQKRAKLFLPFDSLKGLREMLLAKEKIIIEKKELAPDACDELDWKIQQMEVGEMVRIVYYNGCEYEEMTGMVAMVDCEQEKSIRVVNKKIPILDIYSIDWEECTKVIE